MPLAFEVQKSQFADTHIVNQHALVLSAQQIRVVIDAFALTSNNISYAVFGDRLAYWHFYPASEEGWGRIPVWGYATVTESQVEEIEVGERLYGYFPMASETILTVGKVTPNGLTEASEHRKPLPAAYNRYDRVKAMHGHKAEHEPYTMIFKPLALTSFLIDDFFEDSDMFGAEAVVISSASSKTSLSLGHFMRTNQRGHIIGLTSPGRVGFCQQSGCYDEVLAYDQLETLPATRKTGYVDMSGNGELRVRLHRHLGDALVHNCMVGGTDWQNLGMAKDLPGVKPQFFFAPDRVAKRMGDWGSAGFFQKAETAWQDLLAKTTDWVRIERFDGGDAVRQAYESVLNGKAPSDAGYVCSLNGS